MTPAAAWLLSWMWAARLAPAPAHPMQDEIDRLIGHEVKTSASSYEVLSVADEGAPLVGCVRKRDNRLFLATDRRLYPLTGPLAIARIAGPNYKVWIIGDVDAEQQLFARRIGILAGPTHAQCPVSSE